MPNLFAPYVRRANYYETDQMKNIHHSNYIRWFEEARLDYLRRAGLDYEGMENNGVVIPVTSVSCVYKIPIRFNQVVEIYPKLLAFNGVRMAFSYKIYTIDGNLAVTGESGHCFVDVRTGKPVTTQRRAPDFYEKCMRLLALQQEKEKE